MKLPQATLYKGHIHGKHYRPKPNIILFLIANWQISSGCVMWEGSRDWTKCEGSNRCCIKGPIPGCPVCYRSFKSTQSDGASSWAAKGAPGRSRNPQPLQTPFPYGLDKGAGEDYEWWKKDNRFHSLSIFHIEGRGLEYRNKQKTYALFSV